ncbi:hypothetical protein BJ138DRAFT_1139055 [Hygrophoropsis aurantiaca]|uniref:Uncharacterized protein n=1 Tax=Hygrophoropsis aurantiaca TaxID=72124 RepID=A0ACB8AWD8_9AGAM|nr:hypothetical protein BJ138DRAFT_1139055 [Hygrophoropsis aurantiaca]
MSFKQLPVELLDNVSQNLDSDALAALARTCSSLCPVAQRILYRHVSASAWSRNLAIVVTLSKRPDIARFVRSFYIAIDSLSPVFPAFYRLLANAIVNMSELNSLNLVVDSSASWILKKAYNRVTYPHLVQFNCSFPFDSNVCRFLEKTPSLLELEVDSIPTPFPDTTPMPPLHPTTIPHLSQFIGSSRTAKLIVPGRPVKSIHLNGGSLVEDDIPQLARSSAPVVVLGAVTSLPPVPFLETLHAHLPQLAYLRIMSTQNMFKAPTAEFYEEVANSLALFSELNAFELSGMHWGSRRKQEDSTKRVWQSTPLTGGFNPEDEIVFGTEIFFAY